MEKRVDVNRRTFLTYVGNGMAALAVASTGLAKDGRIVVYMGDDKADACVYKFISTEKYKPEQGRAKNRLLEKGTLYVADMSRGVWIPLTIEALRQKALDKGTGPSSCHHTPVYHLDKLNGNYYN